MLVLGDSIAWGMCASRPDHAWAEAAATQVRAFGSPSLELANRGIRANVISPGNPSYQHSARPSLMERYRQECLDLQPDLVIVAEGVNDMRAGMPLADYRADLEAISRDILEIIQGRLVLIGMYPQRHGQGANDPLAFPHWSRWQPGDLTAFNEAIRAVAATAGALFVDALATLARADLTLDSDGCHLNDLGHRLVGNALFRELMIT